MNKDDGVSKMRGLVLKRAAGQRIIINHETTIWIRETTRSWVSLQIDAPENIFIGRPDKEQDVRDRIPVRKVRFAR